MYPMPRAVLCLAVLALCSSVCTSADHVEGVLAGGPADFVFNPTLLTGAAAKAAKSGVRTFPKAGVASRRTAAQLPGIQGSGLSQTYFELEPCAMRAAHTHFYASGLLYAIDANALAVSFVLEGGPAVVNTITTGASAVFPQGLMHYQQNMDCLNSAKYVITYNSENPGTQNSVNALFELPPDAIQASLGINREQLLALRATMAADPIYQNATSLCHQQCKVIGATTLMAEQPITGSRFDSVPAAEVTVASNIFGRRRLSTSDAE